MAQADRDIGRTTGEREQTDFLVKKVADKTDTQKAHPYLKNLDVCFWAKCRDAAEANIMK